MHTIGWRMQSKLPLLTRGISDLLGLSTPLTVVLIIVVPVLIIGSTVLLIFYYLKSRPPRRTHNRDASKSSQFSTSTDIDQEIGLTRTPFRPGTAGTETSMKTVLPKQNDMQMVSGFDNGAGSESFDVKQYEPEQTKQHIFPPSPSAINLAAYDPRPLPMSAPLDLRSSLDRSTAFSHTKRANPGLPFPQPPARCSPTLLQPTYRRGQSSPRHSPSPRQLSIFPPKHSIICSIPSPATYASSPSPPLLSPISPLHSPNLPPVPRPRMRQHVRHPSIERNSNMPIAPNLISGVLPVSRDVLPTLSEGRMTPEREDYGSGQVDTFGRKPKQRLGV
jgi:hypothetical protein